VPRRGSVVQAGEPLREELVLLRDRPDLRVAPGDAIRGSRDHRVRALDPLGQLVDLGGYGVEPFALRPRRRRRSRQVVFDDVQLPPDLRCA
jgi:hypothetical protein